MKKIIIGTLCLSLLLGVVGCSSATNNTSGTNQVVTNVEETSSDNSALEGYVTNYDEVIAKLQEDFNSDQLTITDSPNQTHTAQLEQFGNGYFYLMVNGISVQVNCRDHLALEYRFNNGSRQITTYTLSGEKWYAENSSAPVEAVDGQ